MRSDDDDDVTNDYLFWLFLHKAYHAKGQYAQSNTFSINNHVQINKLLITMP